MIRFSLFRIPFMIEGWFWLTCVVLGGGLSANDPDDWLHVAVWTLVVLISITVHELGHALSGRYFGADPAIKLHGFGGATFLGGGNFTRVQNILVTAAGPCAGFLFGIAVLCLDQVLTREPYLLRVAFLYALRVNFFWSALNLLPILPLDGGQILRDVLGPRKITVTTTVSFITAVVLCVWMISMRQYFLAVMLALLAYHNYRREHVEGGVIKG